MRKVRILLYHRVEYLDDDYNMQAVTPDNFESQMCYLSEHYDVLSLDSSIEEWFENGSRDAVIISFDDGYYDFLYNAVPVLEKYHMPATIFITTGNIDSAQENWTDSILRAIFSNNKHNDFFTFEDEFYHGKYPTRSYQEKYDFYQLVRRIFLVSSAEKRKMYEDALLKWSGLSRTGRKNRRIMTSEEIKKISQKREISIGAHTVTHACLRHLSVSEQRTEILESKNSLEKIIGKEVKLFSYPFGSQDDYSDVTVGLLKDLGFEKSVVAYPGNITECANLYELNRFAVKNYDEKTFADFMEYCVFGKVYGKNAAKPDLPIEYMGKLKDDYEIQETSVPIVIWGIGYWGRELYSELATSIMKDRIVAFGDNDTAKCGEKVNNILTMSLKDISEMQRKSGCRILVKGKYDVEICKELIQEGLKYIHLIQM